MIQKKRTKKQAVSRKAVKQPRPPTVEHDGRHILFRCYAPAWAFQAPLLNCEPGDRIAITIRTENLGGVVSVEIDPAPER